MDINSSNNCNNNNAAHADIHTNTTTSLDKLLPHSLIILIYQFMQFKERVTGLSHTNKLLNKLLYNNRSAFYCTTIVLNDNNKKLTSSDVIQFCKPINIIQYKFIDALQLNCYRPDCVNEDKYALKFRDILMDLSKLLPYLQSLTINRIPICIAQFLPQVISNYSNHKLSKLDLQFDLYTAIDIISIATLLPITIQSLSLKFVVWDMDKFMDLPNNFQSINNITSLYLMCHFPSKTQTVDKFTTVLLQFTSLHYLYLFTPLNWDYSVLNNLHNLKYLSIPYHTSIIKLNNIQYLRTYHRFPSDSHDNIADITNIIENIPNLICLNFVIQFKNAEIIKYFNSLEKILYNSKYKLQYFYLSSFHKYDNDIMRQIIKLIIQSTTKVTLTTKIPFYSSYYFKSQTHKNQFYNKFKQLQHDLNRSNNQETVENKNNNELNCGINLCTSNPQNNKSKKNTLISSVPRIVVPLNDSNNSNNNNSNANVSTNDSGKNNPHFILLPDALLILIYQYLALKERILCLSNSNKLLHKLLWNNPQTWQFSCLSIDSIRHYKNIVNGKRISHFPMVKLKHLYELRCTADDSHSSQVILSDLAQSLPNLHCLTIEFRFATNKYAIVTAFLSNFITHKLTNFQLRVPTSSGAFEFIQANEISCLSKLCPTIKQLSIPNLVIAMDQFVILLNELKCIQKIISLEICCPLPNSIIQEFKESDVIDCLDTVNAWLVGRVMQINRAEKLVYVHYEGWDSKWNEWISMSSHRLAPKGTFTDFSTALSPTYAIHLSDQFNQSFIALLSQLSSLQYLYLNCAKIPVITIDFSQLNKLINLKYLYVNTYNDSILQLKNVQYLQLELNKLGSDWFEDRLKSTKIILDNLKQLICLNMLTDFHAVSISDQHPYIRMINYLLLLEPYINNNIKYFGIASKQHLEYDNHTKQVYSLLGQYTYSSLLTNKLAHFKRSYSFKSNNHKVQFYQQLILLQQALHNSVDTIIKKQ